MRFSWETKALKTSVVYAGRINDLYMTLVLGRFHTWMHWLSLVGHTVCKHNNLTLMLNKTTYSRHPKLQLLNFFFFFFGRRCCQSRLSVIRHNHSELRSPLSHSGSCHINYMGLLCCTILLGFDAALDKLQSVLPVHCRQLKMCNWVFPTVIVYLKSCTLK